MKFTIPYGNGFKDFILPNNNFLGIIENKKNITPDKSYNILKNAVDNPIGTIQLEEIAKNKKTVSIIISDITRPSPSKKMLETLLPKIEAADIDNKNINIIVATGNHRANTFKELESMVGKDILKRYKVINHNCFDENNLKYLGKTDSNLPIWINNVVANSDLKIITGVITPHHIAGFSGGRKSIMPGIAGIKSLEVHHSFPIRPYDIMLGKIENNSFHTESLKAAEKVGVDFILNVILNNKHEIVSAVAGSLNQAHLEGVKISKELWKTPVKQLADISIVSPGGYPRDIDLHQSQKALSCGELITKPGGTIILVSECRDGMSKFSKWLIEAVNPKDVIERFKKEGYTGEASGKAFMFARGLIKHKIIIVSDKLKKDKLKEIFVEHCNSIEKAYKIAVNDNPNNKDYYIVPFANDILPILS